MTTITAAAKAIVQNENLRAENIALKGDISDLEQAIADERKRTIAECQRADAAERDLKAARMEVIQ